MTNEQTKQNYDYLNMWNQATLYVNNQYIDHEQDRDIQRSYKDANQRRGSSNSKLLSYQAMFLVINIFIHETAYFMSYQPRFFNNRYQGENWEDRKWDVGKQRGPFCKQFAAD